MSFECFTTWEWIGNHWNESGTRATICQYQKTGAVAFCHHLNALSNQSVFPFESVSVAWFKIMTMLSPLTNNGLPKHSLPAARVSVAFIVDEYLGSSQRWNLRFKWTNCVHLLISAISFFGSDPFRIRRSSLGKSILYIETGDGRVIIRWASRRTTAELINAIFARCGASFAPILWLSRAKNSQTINYSIYWSPLLRLLLNSIINKHKRYGE